jgi:pSer/pThr/pTyr-binding forkhead associated (FHA) protein
MHEISLVMFKADGVRRDFPLKRKRVVVGRKNTCDLRIPLSSVSRQHCHIQLDNNQVSIHDLGSSNGTFHNGVRVQEAKLVAGDEIVVGPVVFTLVIDGQPEEMRPVRTIIQNDSGGTTHSSVVGHSSDESASMTTHSAQPPSSASKSAKGEAGSATVDIDDPIAALDALAQAEEDTDDLDNLSA